MSQPYGSPAPGPYVPPAVCGSPAGEPPGRPPLPWLLAGGALLLVVLGVLLAVLLGRDGFAEATLDGVAFDDASGTDAATFTLAADDGRTVPLQVFVIDDGTVCDFR